MSRAGETAATLYTAGSSGSLIDKAGHKPSTPKMIPLPAPTIPPVSLSSAHGHSRTLSSSLPELDLPYPNSIGSSARYLTRRDVESGPASGRNSVAPDESMVTEVDADVLRSPPHGSGVRSSFDGAINAMVAAAGGSATNDDRRSDANSVGSRRSFLSFASLTAAESDAGAWCQWAY